MAHYIMNVEPEDTGLQIGEKYTLVSCSEMAFTSKMEVTLINIRKIHEYAQYRNLLVVDICPKRKRKVGSMFLKGSMVFLRGWDLGVQVDTDFDSFSGNALLNFVGTSEEIRPIVEALNDYKFTRKGIIAYSYYDNLHNSKMLYPEIAKEEDHAVVRRIIAA